jgi:8-oxo-dGTP diphosphatase
MDNRELLNKTNAQGVKGPIIFGKGKILVYTRDNNTQYYPGYLDLPGGGTENGETVFETYSREVKEEFGLDISREHIVYARAYMSSRFVGQTVYFLVAVLPEEDIKKIRFGSEGINPAVIDIEDYLKSEKIMPDHKDRINKFLAERPEYVQ